MRLILIRHGDAYAGLTGTIAGRQGCAGLTDLGRAQATSLRDHLSSARRFDADLLLSSELPRAVETATIVAPALGETAPVQDCDLCEVHTGEADGMDWADYHRLYGTLDMPADPDRRFAPGGDSWNSFNERVHELLGRLATDHSGRTVVAVSHAGVIMASLRLLLGIAHPGPGTRLHPTNTGMTEWQHDATEGRWTLASYNDVAHLAPPR